MHLTERSPRESGREYAMRSIKQNIIELQLAPGSKVSENELAAEMGLSRTPVREALIDLSTVKIVEILPQRGSFISLIDYDLVEEARFMRKVLESAVVELDCTMATPEYIRAMRENVELQQFYLQSQDFHPERLLQLDNAFHAILFDIARKQQVWELSNNIAIHFDRVRNMALMANKRDGIVEDHRLLTEAISRGDAKEARRLIELHLARYKLDEQNIRARFPQYMKN